mgnify:CR=1 FL=1
MPIEDNVITRLATGRDSDGQPFLSPHHLLAASRLERLIRQAQLSPRLTMSYDRARTGERRRSGPGVDDLADCASSARQRLNRLAEILPADCWGVMFDVCGLGKGLQMVETERRWPRRSAKLVLRIGLTQLADAMGLQPIATGADGTTGRVWRGQRLPIIADP